MRRGKSNTNAVEPLEDAVLSIEDASTMRFRQTLSNPRIANDARRILSHALNYASEAESRIMELNARVAQLEALAITDELTGLLNRRGFEGILQRNLLSAARYDEAGLLAYIDLDGFKGINDRHGHSTGDEVLRAVGRYLKQNIRATDYAARIGGDEFAVLFVRAQNAPARERARGLVRGIGKITFPHGRQNIALRASLGFAYYDANSGQAELLARADAAMYADKNKGSRAARMIING